MKTALLFVVALFLIACGPGNKVIYESATEEETTSVEFGSTDLQRIASKMVQSLLNFGPMRRMIEDREEQPIVFVKNVENKTLEHIDLEAVTDTIRKDLIKSGQYLFVDMKQNDALHEQLEYQSDDSVVDQNKAKKRGRQAAPEFMLYGSITSIQKRAGRVKDVYYKFTLNLTEIETGIIKWSDEKEIRKIQKRKMVGS